MLLLSLVFVFFAVSVFISDSDSVLSGDDWPMFRYDVSNSGFTNSSAPLSMPTKLWSHETASNFPVLHSRGSPVIVNGVNLYGPVWFRCI